MQSSGPILITGASGFVGAHLVEHFLKRTDRKVIALTSTSPSAWRFEYLAQTARAFEILKLDLTDRAAVQASLKRTAPTVILNCAAFGAYSTQSNPDRIYPTCFEAVRTLLDVALETPGFEAFVQAGSSSEYGLNCTAPTEDAPTLPDSHYAVAKVAASQLVRFYALKHSLPAWTLRLYSVYGALEESSRLIPKALHAAAKGKLPPLANPSISRDFIAASDVCEAFESVVTKARALPKGEIFNIGSGRPTTLEKLVTLLREKLGVSEAPHWGSMKDRAWDHPGWYSNPSKAQKVLGWSARTDLASGLQSTLRWYRENPRWVDLSLKQSVVPA